MEMVINFIRSVMSKNFLLTIFYAENSSKHQAKRKTTIDEIRGFNGFPSSINNYSCWDHSLESKHYSSLTNHEWAKTKTSENNRKAAYRERRNIHLIFLTTSITAIPIHFVNQYQKQMNIFVEYIILFDTEGIHWSEPYTSSTRSLSTPSHIRTYRPRPAATPNAIVSSCYT